MNVLKPACFVLGFVGGLFGLYGLGHLYTSDLPTEKEISLAWEEVDDAPVNNTDYKSNTVLESWFINIDSLQRQGVVVTFAVSSPDSRYIEFLGNCSTTQITPRVKGEFLSSTQVRYRPVPATWQPADEAQQALLQVACDRTSLAQ